MNLSFTFFKISDNEMVDFVKNLSVMLKSGIAIDSALTSLGEQTDSSRFQTIIYCVRDDVERGTSLSCAFEKHNNVFDTVFISLIRAGETSGTLQENLQFLADWLERSVDLKRDIKAATMYPKLVLTASLFLGGALAVFILPKLIPLFDQLNVELPLITKILLAISLFIERFWFLVLVFIVVLFFAFFHIRNIKSVRAALDALYLHLPFLGSMFRNYQLTLVTQLFATLFKSGLTLNQSAEIVSKAVTNVHYRDSILHALSRILKGITLSKAMDADKDLYPKTMVNIIAVGEKSGTLSDSFSYLATFYRKEVDIQTKKLPIIIEPLLLIGIALIVGFVALSIVLPIYQLTGNLNG